MTTNRKRIRFERVTITNDVAPRGERYGAIPRVAVADDTPIPTLTSPAVAEEPGLLRPGQEVMVTALSANSVTVKSQRRMKPGARTDLQLIEQGRILRGAIDECRVIGLEPLCYEAIFVFDHNIEMPDADLARRCNARAAVAVNTSHRENGGSLSLRVPVVLTPTVGVPPTATHFHQASGSR